MSYGTIAAALAQAVDRSGDAEAFVFPTARLTFRQLAERSRAVARAFLAAGIGRGDRVAVWLAGHPEWPELYFGLASIGAILVPVNTRYKPHEVEYVLEKSGARVLVFKDEVAGGKRYGAILAEATLPSVERVVTIGADYEDFVAEGAAIDERQLAEAMTQVTAGDTAILQFTSGTTAFPKGAELYQAGILLGAQATTATLELSAQDRFFSPQPFYHAGGSVMVMLCPLVTGCPVVVQPYFDATEALELMERERCTATMGHQPHWIEYLNHPDLPRRELRLRKAMLFASPDVNRMVHERLGIDLLSPYGMTETHLGGTSCRLSDPLDARLSTVGRPMPGLEMKLVEGEVCFRGPLLMKGYFRDPERTAEAIDAEGWLHSGDLGVLGDDGNLRLIGRLKEMVRVGGENVAAAEVEGWLLRHQAVKQAVYVGRPDQRLGEVGVAFVELKAGAAASEADLIAHCREGLASFKVPRAVRLVSDWPMSGTGKIQKFLLAEAAREPSA
uniref:O-succinylbenzoate--CoA ligase n=1 Tax=uncultured bacterium 5E7 TaxID=1701324 RepID=A0A0N9HQE4_9BACT|nr:o-succinylbenzoate--CoA ligase [uncultured bacterium 5E7]